MWFHTKLAQNFFEQSLILLKEDSKLPTKKNLLYIFFRARHRRAPIGVDECPGSAACSKCDAFGEGFQFTCDQSCNMCPLCKIFYVKPGCDYCDQGVSVRQDNCKIGEVICDKCKKYC